MKSTVLDDIQWGMFPFRSEVYVSLGTVTLQFPPYWFRSMAIMTTTTFIITACSMTQPFQHQHAIIRLLASLLCLLFYDHAITIFMILTTHILSYLSLTLPGLSLDSHSFDYSFLSHLCSFLLSPSHVLCNHSIFTYDVSPSELLSIMDTLVYIL